MGAKAAAEVGNADCKGVLITSEIKAVAAVGLKFDIDPTGGIFEKDDPGRRRFLETHPDYEHRKDWDLDEWSRHDEWANGIHSLELHPMKPYPDNYVPKGATLDVSLEENMAASRRLLAADAAKTEGAEPESPWKAELQAPKATKNAFSVKFKKLDILGAVLRGCAMFAAKIAAWCPKAGQMVDRFCTNVVDTIKTTFGWDGKIITGLELVKYDLELSAEAKLDFKKCLEKPADLKWWQTHPTTVCTYRPACWSKFYPCATCCKTGKNAAGDSCWRENQFSVEKCCGIPAEDPNIDDGGVIVKGLARASQTSVAQPASSFDRVASAFNNLKGEYSTPLLVGCLGGVFALSLYFGMRKQGD